MLLEEAIAQNKIRPGQTIRVQSVYTKNFFVGQVRAIENNEQFGGAAVDLLWCRDDRGHNYTGHKFITSVTKYKVLRINGRFA